MLTVSANLPDGFFVREGEAVTVNFAVTGMVGQVTYDFRLLNETADEDDYVGVMSSPDYSLFSSIEVTREVPVEILTRRDRVDEKTETFSVEVSVNGAVFDSGRTTEVFQIYILDDIAQHGTSGADRFSGAANGDIYNGYAGRDVIKGRAGDDLLKGGGGADRIVGGAGNDRLLGNGKDDKLLGGGGADFLAGGKGDDVLNGGQGRDVMRGQGGDDVFVFSGGRDIVRDFGKRGDDVIDLGRAKGIEDFADLRDAHLSFDGGDAVIDDLSGNILILRNVAAGTLDADDFLF